MSSHPQTNFRNPSEAETLSMQTLHEATLQELIRARNEAVFQLLHERNKLMHELNTMRGDDTKFPAFDFFSPPDATNIPYTVKSIDGECHVLRFRASQPLGARYPADRRQFDASTQTQSEDPSDNTLVDIDLAVTGTHKEVTSKKRKFSGL